ncbi:hypothetical protein IV203_010634 [Nitzschia inconspicua]|uniref:Uncharacterized protein n=1 Tax=Nitzschia inconspicua TaxID=303405 RepID=A0A9K3KWF1_9STRA|nr:hypothetical protein IV203_010634 [Nitzschia inconspicua]
MNLLISILTLSVLFIVFGLPVALIFGEETERKNWEAAPSTLSLYNMDQVCLHESSDKILNCGNCGACSNVHDLHVYKRTSGTLTEIMTDCAKNDFLFAQDALQCSLQQSGLSMDCGKCWVDNYKCNKNNCMHTCIKQRFFPFIPSWNDWKSEPLDPCIACDEKLCGPAFVECAGANRRRAGIVSDIERDLDKEICDKVDWKWVLQEKLLSSMTEHENFHPNSEL